MKDIIIRFHHDVKELSKYYHRPALVFWIQELWFLVRYGSTFHDYIRYEFYNKNGRGVNEYITGLRHIKLYRALNKSNDGSEVVGDKYVINRTFTQYISRKWLYVNSSSSNEEVIAFINQLDEIMVKPLHLEGGQGIKKYQCDEITDFSEFVDELQKDEFLIEEVVKQHKDMAVLNPHSVNTIRINTLCDNTGEVKIKDAYLRMATKEIAVDNFHSGGCAAEIDINTGIVVSPAMDLNKESVYIVSPVTGEIIVGRKVPSWNETKTICIEIAKKLFEDHKRFAAFDIAVLENGNPELIEINWFGDPTIRQIIGCRPHGKYRDMKNIL